MPLDMKVLIAALVLTISLHLSLQSEPGKSRDMHDSILHHRKFCTCTSIFILCAQYHASMLEIVLQRLVILVQQLMLKAAHIQDVPADDQFCVCRLDESFENLKYTIEQTFSNNFTTAFVTACEYSEDCAAKFCGSGVKLDSNDCPLKGCPCNNDEGTY